MSVPCRKAPLAHARMRGSPHDACRNGCHNPARRTDTCGRTLMLAFGRSHALMRWTIAAAGLALLSAASPALAAWPERNITLIACFPAGGGTDVAARLIAPGLGDALGTPVIVENRGGAGG